MKVINIASTSFDNIQEFAGEILGVTEAVGSICKAITVHGKRKQLFNIQSTFDSIKNKKFNKQEIEIQAYFDKLCRLVEIAKKV